MASVLCPRTLVLHFPPEMRGTLTARAMVSDLLQLLGVSLVSAVQIVPNGKVRVTFVDVPSCSAVVASGVTFHGHQLPLSPVEPQSRLVYLRDLPSEVPDRAVKSFFGSFGVVQSVSALEHPGHPGVLNGTRLIRVALRDDVPSSVRLAGFECRVWYPGQPRTCPVCRQSGHRVRDCPLDGLCRRCRQPGHTARACPGAHGPRPQARGTDREVQPGAEVVESDPVASGPVVESDPEYVPSGSASVSDCMSEDVVASGDEEVVSSGAPPPPVPPVSSGVPSSPPVQPASDDVSGALPPPVPVGEVVSSGAPPPSVQSTPVDVPRRDEESSGAPPPTVPVAPREVEAVALPAPPAPPVSDGRPSRRRSRPRRSRQSAAPESAPSGPSVVSESGGEVASSGASPSPSVSPRLPPRKKRVGSPAFPFAASSLESVPTSVLQAVAALQSESSFAQSESPPPSVKSSAGRAARGVSGPVVVPDPADGSAQVRLDFGALTGSIEAGTTSFDYDRFVKYVHRKIDRPSSSSFPRQLVAFPLRPLKPGEPAKFPGASG